MTCIRVVCDCSLRDVVEIFPMKLKNRIDRNTELTSQNIGLRIIVTPNSTTKAPQNSHAAKTPKSSTAIRSKGSFPCNHWDVETCGKEATCLFHSLSSRIIAQAIMGRAIERSMNSIPVIIGAGSSIVQLNRAM